MMGKYIDLTGKKIGRLTVIKRGKNMGTKRKMKPRWVCICDCGKRGLYLGMLLRDGKTKSCGCLHSDLTIARNKSWTSAETPIKDLYCDYRNNAKRREIAFNLSLSQFKKTILEDCFYCGIKPSQLSKLKPHSLFRYNGIDRINSKIGYSETNVVPCCKECNVSKRAMSQKEFFQWIEKLYLNLKITKRI